MRHFLVLSSGSVDLDHVAATRRIATRQRSHALPEAFTPLQSGHRREQ
jgi:hypothetical protein